MGEEDRDAERKREHRAEYSAAVSRLADSGCSCSECSMRGRQRAQETAVKEQKEGEEEGGEKREHMRVWENTFKCARFCRLLLLGLCLSLQECVCLSVFVQV